MAHPDHLARFRVNRFPGALPPAVDYRRLSGLLGLITQYHLERQPVIGALVRDLQLNPSARLVEELSTRIEPFIAFHQNGYPFPVAHDLAGRAFDLGLRQKADGQHATEDVEEGMRSGIIAAPTGEGKSTLLFHLGLGARRAGVQVIIISPKKEPAFRALAVQEGFRILLPTTALNMIRPDGSLSLPDHVGVGVDTGRQSLFAGEDYAQITTIAYTRAHQRSPDATMHDVIEEVDRLQSKGETYKFRDAQRGARLRHERLINRFPGWHTRGAPGLEALFSESVYLPLAQITEAEDFLIAYFLRRFFHYNQMHDTGDHLVLADEGVNLFAKNPNTISGISSLSRLQGMGRSAHLSFFATTNALRLTDEGLRSNAYTFIALRPADGRDAQELQRVLHLTDEQTNYAVTMPRGEAIVHIPRIGDAILTTYDPVDASVSDEQFSAAVRRTDEWLKSRAPQPETHDHQRTPAPLPTPVVQQQTVAEPQIAVDDQERELLAYTERNGGVILTTDPIRDLGWHPQTLTRKKKKLISMNLLIEERIVCRAGRGGTGRALLLTQAGARLVGKTRTATRGHDSAQHRYLATRLAAQIQKAQLERMVGQKSVDILVGYNAELHLRLIKAIDSKIALNNGDLIAIEIEASDPKKTIANNVEKNNAAGIALTIIAVLPKALPKSRAIINSIQVEVRKRVVLVDALNLLDKTREEGS